MLEQPFLPSPWQSQRPRLRFHLRTKFRQLCVLKVWLGQNSGDIWWKLVKHTPYKTWGAIQNQLMRLNTSSNDAIWITVIWHCGIPFTIFTSPRSLCDSEPFPTALHGSPLLVLNIITQVSRSSASILSVQNIFCLSENRADPKNCNFNGIICV